MLGLKNCYKEIIKDICDWKTLFGSEALLYDGCNDYTVSSPITIQTLKVTDTIPPTSLVGGSSANGKGCWRFAEWTNWAPYLAEFGHSFFSPEDYHPPHMETPDDLSVEDFNDE